METCFHFDRDRDRDIDRERETERDRERERYHLDPNNVSKNHSTWNIIRLKLIYVWNFKRFRKKINFIERNDQMNHEFKCHWIQVIKSVYMTQCMYFYVNEDV